MNVASFSRRMNPWMLLASVVWLASGCGQDEPARMAAPPEPGPEPIQSVRISQGSDVLSLDPHANLESPTFSVQCNLYEPLTDTDAENNLVPCLAERWENVDETTWMFYLRDGVQFHGGEAFTADDVVFTLRRALDWPKSRLSSEIQTIETVDAVDENTVRITTRGPDVILPLRLTMALMMNREWTEAQLAEGGEGRLASQANGTGAYKLTSFRKDEACVLTVNEAYWGDEPDVKELIFDPTASDATRMAGLQRGEFDLVVHVPPRYVEQVEGLEDYSIIERPSLRLIYLGLDCGRKQSPGILGLDENPLTDPRVRQAIALGIDNELIVKTIMAGHATPADQLLPPGVTGHDPNLRLDRPDYERAQTLLAEAGYPEGFAIRLDGPNDRYINDEMILQAVAQELAQIGIEVEVNAMPKARFFSMEREGETSFFLIGWSNSSGDGAATFEHLLHTPDRERELGGGNTATNYSNPQLDALTEAAAQEFDPQLREGLLQKANAVAMGDLPHIPLHFQNNLFALNARLQWQPRLDTQIRGMDLHIKHY